MSTDAGFIALLEDLLAPVGPIRIKRMFGGAGIYADGVMFAIVDGEALYFKTDEANAAHFEAEGMGPFRYRTKTGEGTLRTYWQVPGRLFDEPDDMVHWARRSIAAALAGKSAVKASPPKKRSPKAMTANTTIKPSKQR